MKIQRAGTNILLSRVKNWKIIYYKRLSSPGSLHIVGEDSHYSMMSNCVFSTFYSTGDHSSIRLETSYNNDT